MPGFSQRLGRVEVAASVAMTIKARELRAAGKPVITLTTGEPNFDSPPHAIEAAHQAALTGDTKYPPQDGTRAFKEATMLSLCSRGTTRSISPWKTQTGSTIFAA